MAKVKRSNNEMKKGATLSLMATLWAAADKLRRRMDAAEYKRVVWASYF